MSVRANVWLDSLPGVRKGEALAPRTTYRIGGPAEHYLETSSRKLIGEVLQGAAQHGVPVLALGAGSNLLVADAGVAGLVVRVTDTSIAVEGTTVRAGAGARMVKIAQAAAEAGLTGMEWALGIPGTAGGSAVNNAGCFGSDMAATVKAVETIAADGVRVHSGAEIGFRYRSSNLRDGRLQGRLVTAVTFQLRRGGQAAIRRRMEEIQKARHKTQPVKGRSTGSVFKNPDGDFAARLIDQSGLKGMAIGGAMVSPEHANFIVNTGTATAADVAALARKVRALVAEKTGVHLELEIEAVGRWPGGRKL